jgi:hypothetical protein
MGAETRVWVKAIVAIQTYEWIEVSAVTMGEARDMVAQMPNVVATLDATYDDPDFLAATAGPAPDSNPEATSV